MHTSAPTDPSLPPHCLAWHWFPLTQMVMGEWDTKRDRHRGNGISSSSKLLEFVSGLFLRPYIFSHTSCVPAPYVHPPANRAIHPSFSSTGSIYHSQPPSIHQCSIWTLSTVLQLPPTAIHPFSPPIRQSVPQTMILLVSWPFTHLLTSEMWPFSHSSFFFPFHVSIHRPSTPCSMSREKKKCLFLPAMTSYNLFF